MKNYHNSFLSYFAWEEPESIMISSTQIATPLLLCNKWEWGSGLAVAIGDVAMANVIPGLYLKYSC